MAFGFQDPCDNEKCDIQEGVFRKLYDPHLRTVKKISENDIEAHRKRHEREHHTGDRHKQAQATIENMLKLLQECHRIHCPIGLLSGGAKASSPALTPLTTMQQIPMETSLSYPLLSSSQGQDQALFSPALPSKRHKPSSDILLPRARRISQI